MPYKLIIFLVINFTALGIGSFLMGEGSTSEWYTSLNRAPWTPPGWSFGVAWTIIMVCFAVYMAYAWQQVNNRNLLILLFAIQWILNVSWPPVFFKFHQSLYGLIIIIALTILMGFFLFFYLSRLKAKSLLVLPYVIWLLIATSLNGYIYWNN